MSLCLRTCGTSNDATSTVWARAAAAIGGW